MCHCIFFPWCSIRVYFRALINSFYLCSRLFRQTDSGTISKRNLVSLQRSKVGISATQLSTSLVTKIYLELAYWMVESPINIVLFGFESQIGWVHFLALINSFYLSCLLILCWKTSHVVCPLYVFFVLKRENLLRPKLTQDPERRKENNTRMLHTGVTSTLQDKTPHSKQT